MRRLPASRPGKGGDAVRGRRSTAPSGRAGRNSARVAHEPADRIVEPIRRLITESVEHRSEQRLGFTARRAAILASVVCVLTLTVAGPVRTYVAQRTEMHQLAATEAALRSQIAELEQQKGKLADPAYIAAQARERLGFVKPGDVPYQVQLPPTAADAAAPGAQAAAASSGPWYSALWHTIADTPHSLPVVTAPPAPPAPSASPVPPSPVQSGG